MRDFVTCLWFDDNAREAAEFYVSVFPDGKIHGSTNYGADTPGVAGSLMTIDFEVNGHRFTGLNGGPQFPFTEAISFEIYCEDQAEINQMWDALTADGGQPSECGWLKDKFGVSWQVVPADYMDKMAAGGDEAARERLMQAVLATSKRPFDLAELQAAFEGDAVDGSA